MEIKKEFYESLLSLKFFDQCGNSIKGLYDFDVYEEKSFEKAIKSITKNSWSNIILEEQNKLTLFLHKNHKDIYNKEWNNQAKKNRDVLIPTIIERLKEKDISQEIIEDTKWLLMNILMYNYFSELGHKSELLNEVIVIWNSGHLPCGYSGKYPYGKLKVY